MKRKASSPLERSVKRIATSPGSGRELMQMIRERNVAMLRARSATKIQALFRGYRERPEVYCCAGARSEAACHMRGMTPAICCDCYDPDDCEYNPQGYDPTVPAGETYNPEDYDPCPAEPPVCAPDKTAQLATKIQALFRGYIFRRRLAQCTQSLFRAKATAFMRCHRDHGMFPEMKAEYHDFLWQCLKQAVTSI